MTERHVWEPSNGCDEDLISVPFLYCSAAAHMSHVRLLYYVRILTRSGHWCGRERGKLYYTVL